MDNSTGNLNNGEGLSYPEPSDTYQKVIPWGSLGSSRRRERGIKNFIFGPNGEIIGRNPAARASMAVDPFEARMRFTQQLQHLSASVTSSQKAAQYALKYRDWDEDLHSCILEQLERNNMNNRANIMSFIEQFCEMATKEDHLAYVLMIQRDILRIVDAVVPPDGSGAANVKHVRRILGNLQNKEILTADTVAEIDAALKDRDANPEHYDLGEDGPQDETSHGVRPDKRQIEQRIEEDRERNKRERESYWIVQQKDSGEWEEALNDNLDYHSDDHSDKEEQAIAREWERKRARDMMQGALEF